MGCPTVHTIHSPHPVPEEPVAVKQRNCILGKGDAHTLEGDWMRILNWHSSGSRLATGSTGV